MKVECATKAEYITELENKLEKQKVNSKKIIQLYRGKTEKMRGNIKLMKKKLLEI